MPVSRYLQKLLFLIGILAALPLHALESVTLQLKWTHVFQFAGYYAAKEQGYYREAELDVNIQEALPHGKFVLVANSLIHCCR